jgi:hypothetical protein
MLQQCGKCSFVEKKCGQSAFPPPAAGVATNDKVPANCEDFVSSLGLLQQAFRDILTVRC